MAGGGELTGERYRAELERLQVELVTMQEWVRATGARVAVLFEGRDGAGKGGTISRITEHLNPRAVRVAALPAPNERERSEWYFQRYIERLPSGGEIVLFDRSWYNRAGVELVMGFCTPEEHRTFLRQCPRFEELLIETGLILVKYWFSVGREEQERRFQERLRDPLKRWKLSPVDLESRLRWDDYSRAKDLMFAQTDTPESPWWVVDGDDKRRARLNCIAHLLGRIPYENVSGPPLDLPPAPPERGELRPAPDPSHRVPDHVDTLG